MSTQSIPVPTNASLFLLCAALLFCLGVAPARADVLKLTETRVDKSVCDPDFGCSVATAGRYTMSLSLSAATVGEASSFGSLGGLLDDAYQNDMLEVSLSIGDYYFDDYVINDAASGLSLSPTSAKAIWIDEQETCVDEFCENIKLVQDEKLAFSANAAKGVTLNLSGSNLNNDFNSYGQSLFQTLCLESGAQKVEISVLIGDAEITKEVLVNCKVTTKQDADLNDLLNQKISAKLAAPSCGP